MLTYRANRANISPPRDLLLFLRLVSLEELFALEYKIPSSGPCTAVNHFPTTG
jgi:hypothetical protein